ncbi:HIT family protein [Pseudoalteromonas denitrificans]|uniref:Histidine triad (HIT) family protein n=1 Tax=Pseudoalteromonas denitrificans DSM 6059 TaxID=1123010 RepID=A0A1I1IE14_9GAMM|nr:HIT domain-containing protein [Pseudoalteromonas denitrificans]SFC31460.1 histidine triad (HIT) family protein [Pseudoalteromonas denitrificans DSM 6059]
MKYKEDDFYCDKVLTGDVSVEVVKETDAILAFKHTKPYWPVHIVIIPKIHINSFVEIEPPYKAVFDELIKVVQTVAQQVKNEYGAARVLTNVGDYQDSKHLHFHVNFGEPL